MLSNSFTLKPRVRYSVVPFFGQASPSALSAYGSNKPKSGFDTILAISNKYKDNGKVRDLSMLSDAEIKDLIASRYL